MSENKVLARQEFTQHWPLVVAGSIGFSFTAVMTASAGLFMGPLTEEFGWSRTLVSSGITITSVLTFLFSPLFGMLIDKIGTRRLVLPGLVLLSLTIASLSTLTGSHVQWYAIWIVYSVAALATKSTTWTAAVNSTFVAGRGLALGLVLAGSMGAQVIVPPLGDFLIAEHGWRMAYVWLGLGWGAVALLLCVVWFRDGYYHGQRARAADPEASKKGPLLDVPGLSVDEARRNVALWRISISAFVIMVVTIGVMVHQIPILIDLGTTRTSAAIYASFGGVAGITGKLLTGVLLDRYPARWIGGLTIGVGALTFLLLLIPDRSAAIVITAIVINGYTSGAKLQIVGFLTAAYAGMRNFGTIFGVMASLLAAGSGLGPLVAGQVFDQYGSYVPFLYFGVVGTLVSAFLLAGLPSYPDWKAKAPDSPAEA
ncbi:MAG: MFS transporter [Novosphingobium sp.]|nr:MFS transporter [Novosphingobium sp.]